MVSHTATAKSLKVFEKEVEKYDLDVEHISLIAFRRNPREFCSCK